MGKQNFVMTRSNLVADVLKKNGFTFVSHQGDTWTFLNDGKHTFSEDEKQHTVITNKIFV